MSDDVLITPASRKIEFFDNGGNIDGKIELDASGNLNITSAGSIAIGDITQDIHIGDGTQAVDLVFDFASSIYSVANQDLTIGKGSLGGNDVTIDGAGAVLLSLAGTEQARLTSTGLGIGVTAPTDQLCVRGGIKIGEFNDADGTGYAGTAAPNSANTGTGSSDPQLRVSGRTSDAPGIIQMAYFDANNFFGGTTEFVLGRLQYAMNENSQEVTTVAELRGVTSDPNEAGHFDGALTFYTSQGDGSSANLTEKMRLTSDGTLEQMKDTDAIAYHGRAAIGYSGHSDYAAFGHLDTFDTGGYALLQYSDGKTFLNAEAGQSMYFRIHNNDKMILTNTGNVGIGTTSPEALLDVNTGSGIAIQMGADVNATTLTDDTRKYGRFATPHYHNAEEPMGLIVGDSDGTDNIVNIGGGSNAVNAATNIRFWSATDDATLTGTERMRITSDGNVGIGTTSPGHKLHVTGPADDSGDYAIYADEGTDQYVALVNRHSANRATAMFYRNINGDYTSQPMVTILQDHADDDQVCLYIKQDGTGNAVDVSGTVNTANLKINGAQGSDGQVLTSTGSGVAWEDATGDTDTNTFVIFGEESDQYVSSEAGAGNANGFFISYGNGSRNITNSSSGLDHGVVLPVNCTLTRVDFNFGNVGSETNSSNQTITVYKNESASTTTMVYNASGSGGNVFQRSFTSLTGTGTSYSAGDRFNVRATGLAGYTDTQVGPTRMTAYFTVA